MSTCDTCQSAQTDTAYGCPRCAARTTALLAAIAELAPAARAVAAGQTRRGPAVHTGTAGSRLPINLAAAQRIGAAQNALTGWARHVAEERGFGVPVAYAPDDQIARVARWLPDHLDWLRHRREWAEAYRDVAAAERVLRGVVDGPGERELVGACPCGTALYARPGRTIVVCPDCQAEWGTVQSREILLRHVEGMLLTAAEIAGLAVMQDPERDRQRVRKLINMWTGRGAAKGGLDPAGATADGDPTYRVGEVLERLAEAERWRARRDVITRDTVTRSTTGVSTAGSAA